MKTTLFFFVTFFTLSAHAQTGRDTLVVELAPASHDITGWAYAVQGKVTYKFGKYYELTAIHNRSFLPLEVALSKEGQPVRYKPNTYSAFTFSTVAKSAELNSTRKLRPCEFKVDLGFFYSRYYAKSHWQEYYTYDSLPTGERQTISNIHVLSALAGLTFSMDVFKGNSEANAKWSRQYNLSFGFLHGLNYYLDGFSIIEGENPVVEPPAIYGFRRDGYYSRFNFQQRISKHLFMGIDLFFYRTPYVQYKYQKVFYVPRGGEREYPCKFYPSIIIGYHF